jgi:F0F1-type ATP synthase membrane subunit b/b'
MKDIIKEVMVILITIILTMAGFWLMIGRDYITRSEAQLMIEDNQKVIQNELSNLSKSREELSDVLKDNTNAITELRIAIAKITSNADPR